MSKSNELAFPHHEVWDDERTDIGWIGGGLTKREYFAAKAMQGLLAFYSGAFGDRGLISGCEHKSFHLAREAVVYADALLDALEAKS